MKHKPLSRLYYLQGDIVEGESNVASSRNSDMNQSYCGTCELVVWEISLLSKQNFLNGYKNEALNFCKHCMFGKQIRVKFSNKADHKTKCKLDYIHLWDPNKVPSKTVSSILRLW